MRAGRDQAELVKAYADEAGISLRSAQRHRHPDHPKNPEFTAFVKGRAVAAVRTASPKQMNEGMAEAAEMVSATLMIPEGASPEEMMEAAALETWKAIKEFQNKAIAAKDLVMAASVAKPEMDAQESYRKAKRAREQAEIAVGTLIPAEALDPVRKAVAGVARLLGNAPTELGPRTNPPDPVFGTEAVREWLRTRFNPQLQEVAKELEKALRRKSSDASEEVKPEVEEKEAA